jgi:hypothetical protein
VAASRYRLRRAASPTQAVWAGSFDPDQGADGHPAHARDMAGIDWTFVLSMAATIALAVGAICILLFAM